jgi:hypothetical protein
MERELNEGRNGAYLLNKIRRLHPRKRLYEPVHRAIIVTL